MKTAIFGGAFDPIHNGHMNMIYSAMKEYSLDRVIVVPSGHSPNKDENNMTAFAHRFNMCCLAVNENSHIIVSDIENKHNDTTYTYATLSEFRELYPKDELYFIMGADSLDYFDEWFHPEIIARLATILVIARDDMDIDLMADKIRAINQIFPADIRIVHCKKINISSTIIRDNINNKEILQKYLPLPVLQYISENELYR